MEKQSTSLPHEVLVEGGDKRPAVGCAPSHSRSKGSEH